MVLPVNYNSVSEIPAAELAGFKRVGKVSIKNGNVKVKSYTYEREAVSRKMYRMNRFTGVFLTIISLGLFKLFDVLNTKNLLKGLSRKDVKGFIFTKEINAEKKSKQVLSAELVTAKEELVKAKEKQVPSGRAVVKIKDLVAQQKLIKKVRALEEENILLKTNVNPLDQQAKVEKTRSDLKLAIQIGKNSKVLAEKLHLEVTALKQEVNLLKACMTPLPADDEVLA